VADPTALSAAAIRRLLRPQSVALIGGSWTDAVAAGIRAIGYSGEVWRVNPNRSSNADCRYYQSVDELPGAPDQAFVAVRALDVPDVAAALARRDAGGFVCFASGFSELGTPAGLALSENLLRSAGPVPFFGPNCYGIINFFDRCALWPDQLVGDSPERGVALICQSGTLAMTMMSNHRSVPIGYIFTVGNQTRLALEDLIEMLCTDPRVSAFGLYVEGIKDHERFAQAAAVARAAGKPIALVKAGRTEVAVRTAQSHTGALTGSDAVFDAFCRQAGIARCDTLSALCETLKVLHVGGPLAGRRVLVMGYSGGDMAMTADVSRDLGLTYPPFQPEQAQHLRELLGERVSVANPFDLHTYIWFDLPRQREVYDYVMACGFDSVALMLDCPPESSDLTAFTNSIEQFVAAGAARPAARAALLASLPETIPGRVRAHCLASGVVPLQGQREALEALDQAGAVGESWRDGGGVQLRRAGVTPTRLRTLSEFEAKAALAAYGVPIPHSRRVPVNEAVMAAAAIGYPIVMKAAADSLAHKSDVGGVVLNIRTPAEAAAAASRLGQLADTVLVDQMVVDGVAELLVGAIVDTHFGLTLVLGAGGVLTELLNDTVSLLPPFTRETVHKVLQKLRVYRLLGGYRGRPAGDVPALLDAILAVARYAEDHLAVLAELDVNPVIVRPVGAGVAAVDALIRLGKET
jgi:acetate---CoA ligase (ADP-forming)